jgi:hypothetical protein
VQPETTLPVQRDSKIFKRRWVWAFALAALIFVASSRSNIAAPDVKGTDKVGHFAVYGLLATLVLRAITGADDARRARAAWASAVIVSLYGITDEWHQSFTPGRSVELADWIADTSGGVLAVLLYAGWASYRRWLETPIFQRRQPRVENPVAAATSSSP